MLKYDSLFVNEDISKPENRLNLAIFHLQMNFDFHKWFCHKLSISPNALIYPKVNSKGKRPDYVIELNNVEIGVIEVELGKEDKLQLIDYSKEYEKVFSISGKSHHDSHLSLDEIREFIKNNFDLFKSSQSKLSATYLVKLIENFSNNATSSKRNPVSNSVLNSQFVSELISRLQSYKPDDDQNKAIQGKYYCDTTGKDGFSFRVYSPTSKVKTKSTSLFSITKGRSYVTFLSEEWYRNYLSHIPKSDVDRWVNFITLKLKLRINTLTLKQKTETSISTVKENFDELIDIIIKLI